MDYASMFGGGGGAGGGESNSSASNKPQYASYGDVGGISFGDNAGASQDRQMLYLGVGALVIFGLIVVLALKK